MSVNYDSKIFGNVTKAIKRDIAKQDAQRFYSLSPKKKAQCTSQRFRKNAIS